MRQLKLASMSVSFLDAAKFENSTWILDGTQLIRKPPKCRDLLVIRRIRVKIPQSLVGFFKSFVFENRHILSCKLIVSCFVGGVYFVRFNQFPQKHRINFIFITPSALFEFI
jgi:hypothetical protein